MINHPVQMLRGNRDSVIDLINNTTTLREGTPVYEKETGNVMLFDGRDIIDIPRSFYSPIHIIYIYADANKGSDNNSGISPDKAVKTIQAAFQRMTLYNTECSLFVITLSKGEYLLKDDDELCLYNAYIKFEGMGSDECFIRTNCIQVRTCTLTFDNVTLDVETQKTDEVTSNIFHIYKSKLSFVNKANLMCRVTNASRLLLISELSSVVFQSSKLSLYGKYNDMYGPISTFNVIEVLHNSTAYISNMSIDNAERASVATIVRFIHCANGGMVSVRTNINFTGYEFSHKASVITGGGLDLTGLGENAIPGNRAIVKDTTGWIS